MDVAHPTNCRSERQDAKPYSLAGVWFGAFSLGTIL